MPDVLRLATCYASWIDRATHLHSLISEVADGATYRNVPGDGSVVLVVPAAAWLTLENEAANPLPPLDDALPSDDVLFQLSGACSTPGIRDSRDKPWVCPICGSSPCRCLPDGSRWMTDASGSPGRSGDHAAAWENETTKKET